MPWSHLSPAWVSRADWAPGIGLGSGTDVAIVVPEPDHGVIPPCSYRGCGSPATERGVLPARQLGPAQRGRGAGGGVEKKAGPFRRLRPGRSRASSHVGAGRDRFDRLASRAVAREEVQPGTRGGISLVPPA